MSKKNPQPIRQSAIKAAVRTPLYRQRIVGSKTAYRRKDKHGRREDSRESWLATLAACASAAGTQ